MGDMPTTGPFVVLKRGTSSDGFVFDSIHTNEANANLRAMQLVEAPDNNFQAQVFKPCTLFEVA